MAETQAKLFLPPHPTPDYVNKILISKDNLTDTHKEERKVTDLEERKGRNEEKKNQKSDEEVTRSKKHQEDQ